MIATSEDLNPTQLDRLGRMLMHRSDDLSDALWEEYDCNPDAVLSHPTIVLEIGIDWKEYANTFSVRLVDRTSRQALVDKDARWWVQIDEHVGSDGECTLADVVDFLGSETYDLILKNPLLLRAMAVDMLKRYPKEDTA